MPNMFQPYSMDPDFLRMQQMYGNMGMDMPSQGGIGGNMDPSMDPMASAPPAIPDMSTDQNPPNPFLSSPTPDQQPTNDMAPYDASARMSQLYTPEHSASDRLNALLNNYPQEHEPSRLRRLGAALLTGGLNFAQDTGPGRGVYNPMFGMDAGKAFLDEPFNKDLANWKNQVGPATAAAQIEREGNVNERQMAFQTISAELKDQAEKAKERKDEQDFKVKSDRAAVYRFKAEHPNAQFVYPKGGNVQVYDPSTKQTTTLLGDDGLPVSTGSMSDADKLATQQAGKMEVVGAQGQTARDVAGIRADATQANTEEKGWTIVQQTDPQSGQVKVFRVNPGLNKVEEMPMPGTGPLSKVSGSSSAAKPPTSTAERIRLYNKAAEAFNTHPEWRPFINLGLPGANDFQLKEQPNQKTWRGQPNPDYDAYQSLIKFIYGDKQEQPQTANTPAPTAGAPSRAAGPGPLTGGSGGRGGGAGQQPQKNPKDTPQNRQMVIDYLRAHQQDVTEANIQHLLSQIK